MLAMTEFPKCNRGFASLWYLARNVVNSTKGMDGGFNIGCELARVARDPHYWLEKEQRSLRSAWARLS